ncbi:Os06g0286601 [Oryza sativa Japonica Group]|uniref:Os06g0286601 protein n=1 Tax=Oryza sativa subsp. japonica TaxID=39947 RepID=A0A0P0WVV6_ORYSJ|nr:Os06g0286601 [Oryza sativa Japonica Group]
MALSLPPLSPRAAAALFDTPTASSSSRATTSSIDHSRLFCCTGSTHTNHQIQSSPHSRIPYPSMPLLCCPVQGMERRRKPRRCPPGGHMHSSALLRRQRGWKMGGSG